jgi:nickel/cobalt transporter (NicO) family protein
VTIPGSQDRRPIGWAVALAGGLLLALPGIALAHPLGNFTVNHYAGIRVEPDRIVVDVVIDEAEIPTFQDRLRIDTDGDGVISDDEANAERLAACPRLVPDLALTVDGRRLDLIVFEAGLSFPPGTAGLSTMRLVCEFSASVPGTTTWPARIGFDDTSHPGRIGWHEVVLGASGVTLQPGALPATSISDRLRTYPPSLIPHPLNVVNVSFTAALGGSLTPNEPPADALLLTASPAEAAGDAPAETAPPTSPTPLATGEQVGSAASTIPDAGELGGAPAPSPVAAVPGGVGGIDIAGLLDSQAITPLVLLGALVAAVLLGAGHALTPGHGKTVMGAYLVGSRGTALHAIALGLAVTVSHTLGIVVLAAIILQARSVAPELFNTVAPVVSGGAVVVIGSWLLLGQLHLYLGRRRDRRTDHGPADPGADLGGTTAGSAHRHDAFGRHIPDDGPLPPAPISWRSLFVLGLAGGLIPSTNALIILLAAINIGRPAYGLVLVVAFGLGMAAVLSGVGLVLVLARDRLERWPAPSTLGRLAGYAPLGAACLIFVLGLWLTSQAIGAAPAF